MDIDSRMESFVEQRLGRLSGRLLQGLCESQSEAWIVVSNLEEALKHAGRLDWEAGAEASGPDWLSLREMEASLSHAGPSYPNADEMESLFEAVAAFVAKELQADLVASSIYNDVEGDLWCFVRAEFSGAPSALFTDLVLAYESGGWPCGWVGDLPDGQLVVFDPPQPDTSEPRSGSPLA